MKCNKKYFFAFLKYKLYTSFTSVFFYICTLILNLFCVIRYLFFDGADLYTFFAAVPAVCLILIPVLSAENKFDKCIPLSSLKKNIAKWISVFIEFSFMMLPLFFFIILFGIEDIPRFFLGFFILLLYGSSAGAFCIFFSQVFSKKTAFVLSFFVLEIINTAHLFLPQIYSNYFFSVPLKFLSFYYRFTNAVKGIIDTRDILFFIFMSCFFIVFSSFVSEKKDGRIYDFKQKMQIASIALIFLFGLLDSQRFYFRKDITIDKRFSISSYSSNLADCIQDDIKITYFCSDILKSLYPQIEEIQDYLFEYSFGKKIEVKILDPNKDENSFFLDDYGISSRQIEISKKNKTEFINVYSAIVIEYMGRWDALPFVFSSVSLEFDLTRRIQDLISKKQRKINLLTGNSYSVSKDYSYVIPYLNFKGFVCNEIDTSKNIFEQLQYGGNCLAVFGSSKIDEYAASQIEEYILNGGNVLFAVSPFDTDLDNTWNINGTKEQPIIEMLESYGFYFSENIIYGRTCCQIVLKNDFDDQKNDMRKIDYPLWIKILPQKNAANGLTLFWSSSIEGLNENIRPFIFSGKDSFLIAPDKNNLQSLFFTNPFLVNEKYTESNFENNENTSGLYLNGKIDGFFSSGSRDNALIYVITDQYFAKDSLLDFIGTESYKNLNFLTDILFKINGEDELAQLNEKSFRAFGIKDFPKTNKNIGLIFFPVFIIFFAFAAFFMRKKYVEKLLGKVNE